MTNHHATNKIKKALTDMEGANHARLITALAATYRPHGPQVQKDILEVATGMIAAQVEEMIACARRQLKGEEAAGDAVTTDEAVVLLADHHTKELLERHPGLDSERVGRDMLAVAVLTTTASRKATLTYLERLAAA